MKIWPIILAIILLLLLTGALFFYFATAAPSEPKVKIENPIKTTENLTSRQVAEHAVLEFNEDYVDYLVFAIGGWKLHNPPLSDDTPKIKIIADSEVYVSEIIDWEIITEKKDTDEEDIVIITSKEEVVNSILSGNMKEYIKKSVQEGRTTLELKANYNNLFSKGYLSIYKDITGKSLTGSVVRIFRQS